MWDQHSLIGEVWMSWGPRKIEYSFHCYPIQVQAGIAKGKKIKKRDSQQETQSERWTYKWVPRINASPTAPGKENSESYSVQWAHYHIPRRFPNIFRSFRVCSITELISALRSHTKNGTKKQSLAIFMDTSCREGRFHDQCAAGKWVWNVRESLRELK